MLAALPSIQTRAMESGTINPAALNAPGESPYCHQVSSGLSRHVSAKAYGPICARSSLGVKHFADISRVASTIAPNLLSQPSPRGTKRNRSPDSGYGVAALEGESGMFTSRIYERYCAALREAA